MTIISEPFVYVENFVKSVFLFNVKTARTICGFVENCASWTLWRIVEFWILYVLFEPINVAFGISITYLVGAVIVKEVILLIKRIELEPIAGTSIVWRLFL